MRTIQHLLILVGVLLLLAVLSWSVGSQTNPSDVVRTTKIELVDSQGKLRATLGVDSGRVAVRMFDRNGNIAMTMEVRDDSPRDRPIITFFDPAGRASATVGYPSFLTSSSPDVRWANKFPTIAFFGDDGRVSWHAPPDVVGPWKDARFIH